NGSPTSVISSGLGILTNSGFSGEVIDSNEELIERLQVTNTHVIANLGLNTQDLLTNIVNYRSVTVYIGLIYTNVVNDRNIISSSGRSSQLMLIHILHTSINVMIQQFANDNHSTVIDLSGFVLSIENTSVQIALNV